MLKLMLLSALLLVVVFCVLNCLQKKFLPQYNSNHYVLLSTVFVASLLKSYLMKVLHNLGYYY